jgi:hypothetical protein
MPPINASTSGSQQDASNRCPQGVAWEDHAFPGLCDADEAGGAFGISALSAHPSQADSRSPVGLTLRLRQDKRITDSHHEFPACGEGSLCLLQVLELKRRTGPGKPLEDGSSFLLSSSPLAMTGNAKFSRKSFVHTHLVKSCLFACTRCGMDKRVMMSLIHTRRT